MSALSDRLNPPSLADDELVTFRLAAPDSAEVFLPEGVVARLTRLGEAYNLHVLGVISPYTVTTLDPLQAHGLIEELEFLADLIDDPVLRGAVAEVRPVVLASFRRAIPLVVDWDI